MSSTPFTEGKWTGKYSVVEKFGLILTDLRHENYNLARDVRVFRIWLNPEEKKWPPIYLGTGDFDFNGKVAHLRGDQHAPYNFASYKTLFGFECKYVSKVVKSDALRNDPENKLSITQRYLFTDYGANPPHEPGGVLDAARLFPLLSFSTKNQRINSIRIDYCLNQNVDVLLQPSDLQRGTTRVSSLNQAGVFRDIEHIAKWETFDKAVHARIATTKDFFTAAEKPVQFEIVGRGLLKGRGDQSDPVTWDNIHQWGGPAQHKPLPSTPGAFHAAHLHWRWGAISGNPNSFDNLVSKHAPGKAPTGLGRPEFSGGGKAGGGLVDPDFPQQTIRFAITKKKRFDTIVSNTVEWDFEKEFRDQGTPEVLSRGSDLSLWLSFQVDDHRTSRDASPFATTVFPHGLFFAHNPERNDLASTPTISQSSPDRDVPQIWVRNPDSGFY